MIKPTLSFAILIGGLKFSLAAPLSPQDVIINNIPVPDNNTVVAGATFQSWIDDTVPPDYDFTNKFGSFELMAGSNGSSNVVDIICLNDDPSDVFACNYVFPQNLVPGQYHFRANISGSSTTALSETFEVTKFTFDCETPPAWTSVTSTSDPNYHSLIILSPLAGDVIDTSFPIAGISWGYRDLNNAFNAGISNLSFQFIDNSTGEPHPGVLYVPTEPGDVGGDANFEFNGTALTPGPYKLRANYTNKLENGGKPISFLSELFYAQGPKGYCQGLSSSGSSSDATRPVWAGRWAFTAMALPLFIAFV